MRMMVAATQTRRGPVRRICGAINVIGCGGGGERALLFRESQGAACEKVGFGAFFLNWSGGGGWSVG